MRNLAMIEMPLRMLVSFSYTIIYVSNTISTHFPLSCSLSLSSPEGSHDAVFI